MLARRGVFAESALVAALAVVAASSDAFATRADGLHGAVAAEHRLASAAGVEILQAGGNAVDAAVASLLAGGVVNPSSSGLGGGGFMVVYLAREQRVVALDFRETAPRAAHRNMYVGKAATTERETRIRDGKVIENPSQRGGLAIAVPAEPRGFEVALARFGTMSFAEVAAPAIRLARDGFAAEAYFVDATTKTRDALAADPVLRAELLRADGTPYAVGEIVKRPTLAATLSLLASGGVEQFYSGELAREIVAAARASGGILEPVDLTGYRVKERTPIASTYRGDRIYGMPPPSSGGGVIAEALLLLEPYPLADIAESPATYLHLFAETDKAVFADRAIYYGDPDVVNVPLKMLMSPARISKMRARLSAVRPLPTSTYGTGAAASDAGTAHVSVIDGDGNAVACTSSVNTAFGSKVGVRGFPLNNTMDDFSTQPGAANAFGLVGAEANAIAPGKRPLSSMSPTIVLARDGSGVRLVAGASGGPLIISATLQTMLNVLDFDMDVDAAVATPRIHHQWQPDILISEEAVPADLRASLERRGHTIRLIPALAAASAVTRTKTSAGFHLSASSDPRKGGVPAAY